MGATNFINNKGKIVSQSKGAIYQPIRINLAKLMKSKYTDSWLVKKICRKNKVSQKIPLDTFLSEDSSEKNEARDLLISARKKSRWDFTGRRPLLIRVPRPFTSRFQDHPIQLNPWIPDLRSFHSSANCENILFLLWMFNFFIHSSQII